MTNPTDSPEHVPGQIDLAGVVRGIAGDRWTPEERADLERELHSLREQRELLETTMTEHTIRAVDRIVAATAAADAAGAELDQAVRDARAVGATWQQIGAAAGMTRQSAWKRWSTPDEVTEP